jgi:hypothetical protein
MKLSLSDIPSRHPTYYASKVIQECEFTCPPICERQIAEFLKLKIKSFDGSREPSIRKELQTCCSYLDRTNRIIRINTDISVTRQRLGTAHECSHDIIPWHIKTNHFSAKHDVDGIAHKRIEKEAFACASELLMPSSMFAEDVRSISMSIDSIKSLSERYITSLEATAINYARTHHGYCGILVVEPTSSASDQSVGPRFVKEPVLFPDSELAQCLGPVPKVNYAPLQIKYFARSHRLSVYIPPGTRILAGNTISDSWDSQAFVKGELPASAFGLHLPITFQAECLPLPYSQMVLVLFWLPDNQYRLSLKGNPSDESRLIRPSILRKTG